MERLAEGDAVRFGGRFGTPIAEGIASDVELVVGIATGAGLGPLVGYAEEALASANGPSRIELFGGFRDLADVCGGEALRALAEQYPGRLSFTPCISKPMACAAVGLAGIPRAAAGSTAESPFASFAAPKPAFAQGRVSAVVPGLLEGLSDTTHFHLIGNGQVVEDWKHGLLAGGVSEVRVTTEKYFNGQAEAESSVVEFLGDAIRQKFALQRA